MLLLAGVLFAFDLSIPLGIAAGVTYVLVVLLSLWAPYPQQTILIAAILCTLLTCVGYVFSPSGGLVLMVMFNRLLAIFVIWITAVLGLSQVRSEQIQKLSLDNLERSVDQRTSELSRINEDLNMAIRERIRSEQGFRDLIEFAPDAMLIVDGSGDIVLANSQSETIFEYPRNELIGQPIEMLVPERYCERHLVHRKRYFDEPSARPMGTDLSLFGRRKDGSEFPVEISLSPIDTQTGRVVATTVRDVTQRKLAEEARRDSEERFHHLAQNLDQVFWFTTVEPERVLFVSPAFENIWGIPTTQLYENPLLWIESVHNEDRQRVHDRFNDWVEQRVSEFHLKYRIVRPDGEIRWILDQGIPIHDEQGNLVRLSGIAKDITQQENNQDELRHREAELAHISRLSTMGEMVAGIAHEINQPLYVISNLALACKKTLRLHSDESIERTLLCVKDISQQAEKASQIIQGLSRFLRKSGPRLCPLDLNEVVRQSTEFADFDSRDHRTNIELQLVEPCPLVFADRIQIEQVLVNLFRNACEAMKDTALNGRRICVATSIQGSTIEVAVEDKGIGVTPEDAEKLFEAFYTTKPTGMGMGLAVSRTIIHAHSGRMWMTPNDDRGVTFRFSLPIATDSELKDDDILKN